MRPFLALLLGLAGALTACQSQPPKSPTMPTMDNFQTEKFYLSAAPASADGYPTRIIEGYFKRSDGKTFHVPALHYMEGSWGASGIGEVSGDQNQPAPDSLHLQWFSYTEDKFYEGNFLLPQRRIYDLLKAGWYNTDERVHDTYDELTVCPVPGGVAVVWLTGNQMKTLVGRFQARELYYDWRVYSIQPETRAQTVQARQAELSPAVRQQIAAGTISSRRWDTYLKTYPWRLEVTMQTGISDQPQSEPLTLYDHYIRYLNAEQSTYPPTPDRAPYNQALLTTQPRPVPKYFGLFVKNKYGEKHEIRVDSLDEAETLAAFQTLAAAHPKEPLVLRVEVDKLYQNYRLTLSNAYQTLPLDKATVKVFEEE